MTQTQIRAASDLLWEHWQQVRTLPALPEENRPKTRAEGYAVQARLEARSARPLCGWKIAARSAAGQTHLAVDGPLAGRLLQERVIDAGATLPFGNNHMRVAEAEFAFRLGKDLPPRSSPYAVDEVLAAVATLHPAIEIPDSWRSLDLAAHAVRGQIVGGVEREGRGANVLGDPRAALAWLVGEVNGLGLTVRAGEIVTTGTCLIPLPIAPHDRVAVDFGMLGTLDVQFGA